MNKTQHPTQPPLTVELSPDTSSAIRGAARMVGITPENLADQLLANAIEKATSSLLGKATEEVLFTLAGISGRAHRDLARLATPKKYQDFGPLGSRPRPETEDQEGNK